MRHFPGKELSCAVGFAVLLSASYVGAYYALVTTPDTAIRIVPASVGSVSDPTPEYLFGGDRSARFFRIMHDADRRIRPDVWACRTFFEIHGSPLAVP